MSGSDWAGDIAVRNVRGELFREGTLCYHQDEEPGSKAPQSGEAWRPSVITKVYADGKVDLRGPDAEYVGDIDVCEIWPVELRVYVDPGYRYERYGDIGGIHDMHQHFNGIRFIGRSYRFAANGVIRAQHTHPRSGAMTALGEFRSHGDAHGAIAAYDVSAQR